MPYDLTRSNDDEDGYPVSKAKPAGPSHGFGMSQQGWIVEGDYALADARRLAGDAQAVAALGVEIMHIAKKVQEERQKIETNDVALYMALGETHARTLRQLARVHDQMDVAARRPPMRP